MPELTLDRVAHGGECVGRLNKHVAFVTLGLPGERVKIELTARRARYVRGRVVKDLSPSPERVSAPCPIFGICGGCHWQHATYAAQLRFKTDVLREHLRRLGRQPGFEPEPAIPSPQEWRYRNTVQLVPASAGQATNPGPDQRTGRGATRGEEASRLLCFQQAHSHDLVPVEHCSTSDPLINRVLHELPWHTLDGGTWAALDHVLVRVIPGEAAQVTLAAAGRRVDPNSVRRFAVRAAGAMPELRGVLVAPTRQAQPRVIWGQPALRYSFAGHVLAVPAGAFVQVNIGAAERLLDVLLDWLEVGDADDVLDAYAGAGTFTLPLARRARSVVAVEADAVAAGAGARNAALNAIGNVLFRLATVESALPLLRRTVGRIDIAVLDPPRGGCSAAALTGIAGLQPRRIAYVSCEPSTLARDVAALAGLGYRLVKARVVDFFPQTYHLESLALFEPASWPATSGGV